ncbi:hypothetical protein QSM_3336 [Clostridioides difficile P30]|nr:hypothetical protein QSM_3336 [Clostridioides difficile P30]
MFILFFLFNIKIDKNVNTNSIIKNAIYINTTLNFIDFDSKYSIVI